MRRPPTKPEAPSARLRPALLLPVFSYPIRAHLSKPDDVMSVDEALASLLRDYETGVKERQSARIRRDRELEKSQRRSLKCIDESAASDVAKREADRDELLARVTDFEKQLLALYQDLADSETQCTEARDGLNARRRNEAELFEANKLQLLQERAAEDAVYRSALQEDIVPSPAAPWLAFATLTLCRTAYYHAIDTDYRERRWRRTHQPQNRASKHREDRTFTGSVRGVEDKARRTGSPQTVSKEASSFNTLQCKDP